MLSRQRAAAVSVAVMLAAHHGGVSAQNDGASDLAQDLFTPMDADGSGGISKSEMQQFFDSKGAELRQGLFDQEDTDGDGQISLEEFSGPKPQQKQSHEQAQRPRPEGEQQQQQQQQTEDLFTPMDADGSGGITEAEMSDYFQRKAGVDVPEGLFASDDKNNDGVVSHEEFSGPKARQPPPQQQQQQQQQQAAAASVNVFATLDGDSDGFVTKAEFEVYVKDNDALFAREDKDGDGQIAWAEFDGQKGNVPPSPAAAPGGEQQIDDVFSLMDVNPADGRIEQSEFFALAPHSDEAIALFTSEDADSDSVVSWQEFNGGKGTVESQNRRLAAAATAVAASESCHTCIHGDG